MVFLLCVTSVMAKQLREVQHCPVMSKQPNKKGQQFGKKGRNQQVVSYAEMLLSGQPMGRRKSVCQTSQSHFCARPKKHFGRKMEPETVMPARPKVLKQIGWKTLALWGFAILLVLQGIYAGG